ncbi:MAG: OmcA/MtrC family decaheme c-type cytochrome [Deltaproteobacteria bacterium]|nr:OmcA/MtrC family decaheme c-type cytochrome [Deltaproteobacteria bacterium]
MHAVTPLVPITITGVAFADNVAPDNTVNKIVTVSFDYAGVANLSDNSSATQLAYPRFYLAKLVPGAVYAATGTSEPNVWVRTVSGERVNGNLTKIDADSYTYQFSYNVLAADAALTHRVGIYTTGITGEITRFATTDRVPNGSAVTVTRNIVTTGACQQCHDPLGGGAVVFHGGARNVAEACVLCHRTVQGTRDNTVVNFNPETGVFEGTGAAYFPYMVHKIHGSRQHESSWVFHGKDYEEITYPQDIRNCTTCHKGADGGDWKNKPSIVGCGSCHTDVNFTTGAGHLGGGQPNSQFCGLCHTPALIEGYHATENSTPNNPQLPAGLAKFEYFIDNVTVNASNQAVVKFRITKNGTAINFKDNAALTGFTYGPSFLVAYANNVTNPQDYSNFGKAAGQPASVSLSSLLASLTSTDNVTFTATLASAPYPAGAKMRAVALQGYFSQTVSGTAVGRHTPSVQMAAAGDAVRRTIIKSGYNATTGQPEGCLECHEIFEGHGGNRVNNVQVCVMCHNPNMTSSGRTIDPAGSSPINPDIVALFGSDPLAYPEVPNNFKNLIHGLHSASMRVEPFIDLRNRTTGGYAGVIVRGDEITFPGNLMNCSKCHIGDSYKANLPAGVDFSTAKITTGNSSETMAQINAARATVPNSTDLVISPIVSACGMCHNSDTDRSHFALNGGDVQATREYAEKTPPALAPVFAAP